MTRQIDLNEILQRDGLSDEAVNVVIAGAPIQFKALTLADADKLAAAGRDVAAQLHVLLTDPADAPHVLSHVPVAAFVPLLRELYGDELLGEVSASSGGSVATLDSDDGSRPTAPGTTG